MSLPSLITPTEIPGTSKVFKVSSVSESICAEVMTCAVEVTEMMSMNDMATIVRDIFFINDNFCVLVLYSNVLKKNPPGKPGGQHKNMVYGYSTKIPLACMVISILGCVIASISALLFPASSA